VDFPLPDDPTNKQFEVKRGIMSAAAVGGWRILSFNVFNGLIAYSDEVIYFYFFPAETNIILLQFVPPCTRSVSWSER
jgi:hypothetical protein